MGYYSNLAIDNDAYVPDASITPPEQQLLWRLDDLRDRLDELKTSGALYGGVCRHAECDLRYAPIHCFHTIYEIEAAIALVAGDLKNKYGIEYPSVQEIVILSPYWVTNAISPEIAISRESKHAFFLFGDISQKIWGQS